MKRNLKQSKFLAPGRVLTAKLTQPKYSSRAPAAAARAPAVGYQLNRTYVPIAHVRHSLCHTEHSAFRRVFCDCRRYPLDRQVTAACATPRSVCDARRRIFFIDFLSKLSKGNVYRVRECNRRIA